MPASSLTVSPATTVRSTPPRMRTSSKTKRARRMRVTASWTRDDWIEEGVDGEDAPASDEPPLIWVLRSACFSEAGERYTSELGQKRSFKTAQTSASVDLLVVCAPLIWRKDPNFAATNIIICVEAGMFGMGQLISCRLRILLIAVFASGSGPAIAGRYGNGREIDLIQFPEPKPSAEMICVEWTSVRVPVKYVCGQEYVMGIPKDKWCTRLEDTVKCTKWAKP